MDRGQHQGQGDLPKYEICNATSLNFPIIRYRSGLYVPSSPSVQDLGREAQVYSRRPARLFIFDNWEVEWPFFFEAL